MGASPYLSHLPLADVSSTLAKSTTPAVAGSIHRLPGVASRGSLRLPRAVFWRPFRALIPIAKSTTPAVAGVFPPRMSLTPAPRASFPLAIYGEGVAVRPGVRSFPSLAFKPLDRAIVRLFLVIANAD